MQTDTPIACCQSCGEVYVPLLSVLVDEEAAAVLKVDADMTIGVEVCTPCFRSMPGMSRARITRDEYEIQSNHGYGWDVETTEDTHAEARAQLKTYRENVSAPVRIVKRRVRLAV